MAEFEARQGNIDTLSLYRQDLFFTCVFPPLFIPNKSEGEHLSSGMALCLQPPTEALNFKLPVDIDALSMFVHRICRRVTLCTIVPAEFYACDYKHDHSERLNAQKMQFSS